MGLRESTLAAADRRFWPRRPPSQNYLYTIHMSASINYLPSKKLHDLPAGSPSSVVESLEQTFGSLPRTFTEADLPILRGMSFAAPRECFWQNIVEAIEKHDEIHVSVEY